MSRQQPFPHRARPDQFAGGRPPPRRDEDFRHPDVHELLKREAFGAPGDFGDGGRGPARGAACDAHFEKQRPCPYTVHGVSDEYVVLDSFNKLPDSRVEAGEFRWNFVVQGSTSDQAVGVRDEIDTVTEVQVGSFGFPVLPEVPYALGVQTNQLKFIQGHNNTGATEPPVLTPYQISTSLVYGQYPPASLIPSAGAASGTAAIPWVHNPYSQTPCFGRITAQLKEVGLQSISDRDGARHHFEFGLVYPVFTGTNPNMLLALPVDGMDTYTFTEPIKDIHGLTLVFRNPDIPIVFAPDCLYNATASLIASGPAELLMFTAAGHGLLAGDRVFFRNFTMGWPLLDGAGIEKEFTPATALNNYVNRPEGQVVAGLQPGSMGGWTFSAPGISPDADRFFTDPVIDTEYLVPPANPYGGVAPVLTFRGMTTICVAKRRLRIILRMRRVVPRLTNYINP